MVWLDSLVEWRPGYAVCSARINRDTALVSEHGLHASALIEYMAQAVAACLGYGALRNGEDIRVGMIVASRKFVLNVEYVPLGSSLIVHAERLREVDAVSNFECKVVCGDDVVAYSQLTLYHASEPPA